MISFSIRIVACLLFTVALLGPHGLQVGALSTGPQPDSRREFLPHHVAAFAAICGSSSLLPPSSALAYERRDVGDDSRSATTAAFNEQAYQTNNRLEQEGFKLDTREEEQAKLSAAMASFSYESSSGTASKKKTGFGTSTSASASSSAKALQK
jgi:hypothetical protein